MDKDEETQYEDESEKSEKHKNVLNPNYSKVQIIPNQIQMTKIQKNIWHLDFGLDLE